MKPDAAGIINEGKADGWLVEPKARELLTRLGVDAGGFVWAKSSDEAVKGARRLGFPVAMKVVSTAIVHKSDVGGVAVKLADEAAVLAAFNCMAALPGFDGVVVDRMHAGVELILGAKEDPQFGTVIMVGIGGTAVELYSDVALLLAPATEEEALTALLRLKGKALLTGFRGSKPVNMKALAALVTAFSIAARELAGEVSSIDLNPVFCSDTGCAIADARMVLGGIK